jgi:low temperature requirement protein LtrA
VTTPPDEPTTPPRARRASVPLRRPLAARPATEAHRAASQLELLFDLSFVIAIARITLELAHRVAEGHVLDGLVPFLQVFFAIWWAWMNFTWFASAFDNDDACYRLLVMVQMGGVLVLAAGVPDALDHDNYRGITIGYLIMRLGLIALWLRAAAGCHQARATALRYAVGITALEVAWVLRLALAERGTLTDPWALPVFGALVVAELAVPWWAERAPRSASTTWHPHHIAERYGLFTIILLGESLLTTSTGMTAAINSGETNGDLVTVAAGGFVLTMTLWWLYFLDSPGEGLVDRRQRSFWWGYGHYGVFVALAALGAGLEVAAEHTAGQLQASPTLVSFAVAVPVAVYLVALGAVNAPLVPRLAVRPAATSATVVVVLALPCGADLVGPGVVISAIGATCALLVGAATVDVHRRGRSSITNRDGAAAMPQEELTHDRADHHTTCTATSTSFRGSPSADSGSSCPTSVVTEQPHSSTREHLDPANARPSAPT